ncbi:hypothetical protein PFHG_04310 [Plasmodium falciparum HB3]|uniref:Uncharacterized protein n=1 Tax=Plasmodium falciparum (isolate HB3) TaxID=137071 RepID=A0A0L7KHH3_PLAFX|nr:hypothetical protein PFHG_04310 [Plasmodium falciparum HB3]
MLDKHFILKKKKKKKEKIEKKKKIRSYIIDLFWLHGITYIYSTLYINMIISYVKLFVRKKKWMIYIYLYICIFFFPYNKKNQKKKKKKKRPPC